ncbi:MAG: substrate-binding domain-containing protein [Opitutaceae bacterium]
MSGNFRLLYLGLALAAAAARAQVPPDPGPAYPVDHFNLDALPAYVPAGEVTGTIRIWGSGYIAAGKTLAYWEKGFRKFHPGVTFVARLGDSLTAVPALYTGAADLGSGPRISWNDLKAFNHTMGHDPLAIMVMSGSYNVPGWNAAFAIIVHRDNPIASLSLAQLDGIFGSARDGGWQGIAWHPELERGAGKNLRTWGQLGLTGDWATRPIHVYGANFRYGVSQTMSDALLHGSDRWNEGIQVFTNRRLEAPDATHPDGTLLAVEQIADAIKDDPAGIGFTSIVFASGATRAVPLRVREGEAAVALTLDTVRDRTYPLADESYLYLDRAPGRPVDRKLREFLRYVLSREGQADVARDGKYLPLTAAMAAEQLRKLR